MCHSLPVEVLDGSREGSVGLQRDGPGRVEHLRDVGVATRLRVRRALDVGAFGGATDAEGRRDRCVRVRLERHTEQESHNGDEVLPEDHDEDKEVEL